MEEIKNLKTRLWGAEGKVDSKKMAAESFRVFFEKETNAKNIAFVGVIQNMPLKTIPMMLRLWIESMERKTVADIVAKERAGTIFEIEDASYFFAGMFTFKDDFDQETMVPMFTRFGTKTLVQLDPELEVRRIF
jgi:hypothetical protein